ncbi:MAG: ferritin-like domain-containing protein [Acidimicrobiales bacterium]
MIQVLGAIAYGEKKAYDEASSKAAEATNDAERKVWRTIAAEELRHHKGFARRLSDLGANPERAMAPYRASLDEYHGPPEQDDVAAAVRNLLGEGIAADLLAWLRKVVDVETARFIDTVIADEVRHEARAASEVRTVMAAYPDGKNQAARAATGMLSHMARSGTVSGPSFAAFLRLGRVHELIGGLAMGFMRRLDLLGIGPVAAAGRFDPLGIVARLDVFGTRRESRRAA